MSLPRVVGITGTIGAGKSLVGEILQRRGCIVIDTDQIVHRLFSHDARLKQAIVHRFSGAVLNERNEIDRSKLADIVFADDNARKDLESIVHPAVIEECDRLIGEHKREGWVFVLVPLLFEAGLEQRYDQVWAVVAGDSVLRERLKLRSNFGDNELEARISAQLPQAEKAARSTHVIDNSGTVEQTKQQIDALLKKLPPEGAGSPGA